MSAISQAVKEQMKNNTRSVKRSELIIDYLTTLLTDLTIEDPRWRIIKHESVLSMVFHYDSYTRVPVFKVFPVCSGSKVKGGVSIYKPYDACRLGTQVSDTRLPGEACKIIKNTLLEFVIKRNIKLA